MREEVMLTIVGMALVTYATRASGLYLGRHLRIPRWLDRVLSAMPGAIIVSVVVPEIVSAGVRGLAAAAATVLAAVAMRDNLIVPMVIGALVVAGLRLIR
jgi:uncharacterized membrane protein